ncbi:ribonuclease H-like domain-containing protein [Tanacetum coccineum]
MSVHNYVPNTPHNSEHNSEDETDLNNVVILISKLDLSHPLHLHPNDSTTLTIVSIKLKGIENYNVWSYAMLLALEGRNKTGYIDNTCRRSYTDKVLGRQWDMVNVVVMGWILNSISEELCTCHAAEDFKKHNQLIKLMQFLMDLDDSYMKTRSNILSRDPLLDAKGAYVLISSEESHRAVVTGSGAGSSQRVQSFVFNSSVNNRGSTQRSQNFGNTSRPNNVSRPNISNNRRTDGGPILVCEHCGFNGHTIDTRFKLIGYLSDFGKKNKSSNSNQSNQNFNRRFMNSNNFVGSSSTSSFSDEQITRPISLIKKIILMTKGNVFKPIWQAGIIFDSGANKHLTYTDKDLVNVIDISYLEIIVSHPNGTQDLITKVARDSKFIVGFDELKCFLISQDLMDVKIMRIGRQVNGLYYIDNLKVHQTSCSYTPQQNGIVERKHRHLLNVARSLLLPSSVLNGRSPYQLVFNRKPSLKHLRVFGCLCFATILNNHDKFSSRAEKCVLIGYSSFKKGSNGSANENEMTVTSDHNTALSEDDVDLGKLKYLLGIEVVDISDGICLSQRKYCLDFLSEFGLLACKPSTIPLEHNAFITSEPSDSDPFMHKLLKSHIKIALKVLRYLKGSPGKGIHISRSQNTSLEVFVDADGAKCFHLCAGFEKPVKDG